MKPHRDATSWPSAGAVAAEQPAPAAYRYTRALDRFVYGVNAADGEHGRVSEQQVSDAVASAVWLAERTQVFLNTGSVAALGDRP
jgi:hypothetical protein